MHRHMYERNDRYQEVGAYRNKRFSCGIDESGNMRELEEVLPASHLAFPKGYRCQTPPTGTYRIHIPGLMILKKVFHCGFLGLSFWCFSGNYLDRLFDIPWLMRIHFHLWHMHTYKYNNAAPSSNKTFFQIVAFLNLVRWQAYYPSLILHYIVLDPNKSGKLYPNNVQ